MPGPLVIPQGVQIRLIWQKGGVDHAVNVVGGLNKTAVAINQTLANTLGSAIKSAFTSSGLAGQTANNYQLSKVGLRDINIASQAEFLDSGSGVLGTVAGIALPDNVAYCVTLRTALAGKRFRGRFYTLGMATNANTNNSLPTVAYTVAAAAFVNAIFTAMNTSAITPAVLSRVNLTGTDVVNAVARRIQWNTQRRRLNPGI